MPSTRSPADKLIAKIAQKTSNVIVGGIILMAAGIAILIYARRHRDGDTPKHPR